RRLVGDADVFDQLRHDLLVPETTDKVGKAGSIHGQTPAAGQILIVAAPFGTAVSAHTRSGCTHTCLRKWRTPALRLPRLRRSTPLGDSELAVPGLPPPPLEEEGHVQEPCRTCVCTDSRAAWMVVSRHAGQHQYGR